MRIPYNKQMQIKFHKPYITEKEINNVVATLKSGWLGMGPKTKEFEQKFQKTIGANHAIFLNSGTAALDLALQAIGIKAGDEVIIPTNTYIATAEVVAYSNAIPILCDIKKTTHNMDPAKLENLITKKTKAIIPVHFGGQSCNMDEIMHIGKKHNLKIIEDASHALPATYKNKTIGTIGDITCFSFYTSKTLCTAEGGMAVTNNKDYAEKIRIKRLHGLNRDAWERYQGQKSWYYEAIDIGRKYNPTDINASLGLAQLQKLDWMHKRRQEIAEKYTSELSPTSLALPFIDPNRKTSWYLYVLKSDNRDHLMEKLHQAGIETSVHFLPVHKHKYYKNKFGYNNEDFPVANSVFEKSLSLPIYPGLQEDETDYIIQKLKKHTC
ncbi:DegT/DnrJ/EryC1/StrS family aminotransferase [Candidatus Margulisiibacteriota bacterium]